jgi:hypothetical protein
VWAQFFSHYVAFGFGDTFSGNNWIETRLTLADAPPLDAGSLMGVTFGVTRSSSMAVEIFESLDRVPA